MRHLTKLLWLAPFATIISLGIAKAQRPQPTAGSFNLGRDYNGTTLSLLACTRNGTEMQCDLLLRSNNAAALSYKYGPSLDSKITDDKHVDHPQVNGYFVIGDSKPSDVVTLTKDDTVHVIQIFSGADPRIKTVRVIFGTQYFTTDLQN